MGSNNEEIVRAIQHYQDRLDRYVKSRSNDKILYVINKLKNLPIRTVHLEETGVGRTVNALKKCGGLVGEAAKIMVAEWKLMVLQEEQAAEEAEAAAEEEVDSAVESAPDSSYSSEHEIYPDEHLQEQLHKTEDFPDISEYMPNKTNKGDSEDEFNEYVRLHYVHVESDDSSDNEQKRDYDISDENKSERNRRKSDEAKLCDVESGKHTEEESKEKRNYSIDNEEKRESKNEKSHSKRKRDSSDSESESEKKQKSKKSHSKRDRSLDFENSHKKHKPKSSKEDKDLDSENSHKKHKSKSTKEDKQSSDLESGYKKHKSKSSREDRESSESENSHKKHKSRSSREDKESSDLENSHKKHKSKSSREDKESTKSKSKEKTGNSSDKHNKEKPEKSQKHEESKSSSDRRSDKKDSSKNKHESKSSSKHESASHKSRSHSSDKKDKDKKDETKESKKSEEKNKHKGLESTKKEKTSSSSKKSSSSSSTSKQKSSHNSHTESSEAKPKIAKEKVTPKKGKIVHGIDSESGASFAEALGMCGPLPVINKASSSKKKSTSTSSPEKLGSPSKRKLDSLDDDESTVEKYVPEALKEANLEPLNLNIDNLLPEISPNYRPLGFPIDNQPKRIMTDDEALSRVMSNRNQKTKVYSGNKTKGKVETLFELCVRILQDNIDALEYTGGVPYSILKAILEKATPDQLFNMEHHNPYLIEDTDELWQLHCQKEFRTKKREELESWREMYMRCLDEREARLTAITANIKQSQDKSLPVRTTKLAYVDSVAKPPRNIARKQFKNGISNQQKPTTASKLNALATAGEAGKVSVPNPGSKAVERSSHGGSSAALKPKKAPLMAKTLSFLKNRFRR